MRSDPRSDRLPIGALLALTTAAFITVLTEALPAGVLPGISRDLGISESAAGQTVTVYAIGTALSAIPLSSLTAGWPRKRVLLIGAAGFAVANTVTAIAGNVPLLMGARFVAGIAAGLVWALLAGYARRLAPEGQEGRAIAVVMAGIPAALSLGVPAGTFLGEAFGWRLTFGAITVVAVVLIAWIMAVVPDRPGTRAHGRLPMARTLATPGVAVVLVVTTVFVLAHTIGYTYVAAFLSGAGMSGHIDVALLVFGIASMVSIWIVGVHIDRRLRLLSIASVIMVAVASTALALVSGDVVTTYIALALWGLGWGGVPTLLQTAVGKAGGVYADTAQAALVTVWNGAMAAGGAAGGVLLGFLDASELPLGVAVLLVPVFIAVLAAHRHGFPASKPAQQSDVCDLNVTATTAPSVVENS
ncbi:MFS transporter [Saccharomonospora xinjiangensis]|uniref:Arabinose efflux permease family protein n=1 Tax=Saccharomonospora xinjiangensis XJ-54 TaxID=882086 RepID=I0V246_9PSEU|nr:MFS transporter [Saccharomonospora xinjiangensis]EID54199.1 arabinose efflux permease family protein [Saccharomonospora xinjiangensis XJ-54]